MHHAETIMQAVLANLQNLATTGSNVARGRSYSVDVTPAIRLHQGADEVIDGGQSVAFIARELNVKIIAYVKTGAQFDSELNAIREEVYAAMMADRTQGQGFVFDTLPAGDDEPEESAGDQTIGQQQINFIIHYRHSVTDPGA